MAAAATSETKKKTPTTPTPPPLEHEHRPNPQSLQLKRRQESESLPAKRAPIARIKPQGLEGTPTLGYGPRSESCGVYSLPDWEVVGFRRREGFAIPFPSRTLTPS